MYLVDFPPFLQESLLLRQSVCFPAHQAVAHQANPSAKGSTLQGKNLLPRGVNSFIVE